MEEASHTVVHSAGKSGKSESTAVYVRT